MLQEEITKLGEYFRGIEYYNDAIIVKVIFPLRWQVYPSIDELIKPARSDQQQGMYFYYGDANKVTLDDIFGLIEETIYANKDAEQKIQLLNQKRAELDEVFKHETYERLLHLQFVINDPQKAENKQKRKYTRKKKQANTEQKNDTQEIVSEEVNADKNNDSKNTEE